MVFSSSIFLLIFMPLVFGIYYLLPTKFKNAGLFAASLIFYAWGEVAYIFIMLFSTVFDYSNGLLLEKFEKNKKAKKLILSMSVIVNVGLLCFFKYTNFAIDSINSISDLCINSLNIAMPIGISFYTFQTMSYTIDVYRGNVKAQHNIIDFGMYVAMFPQLIAGPIVRYADVENSISKRDINIEKIANGIMRFVFGLAKKVLIANQVGAIWEEISTVKNIPTLTAWIGAMAFMLQIYFDFSGYSDMALGLGAMLGFEFPENFNYPYESKSITEFWRRWHISLGVWFREYLYIPLGGNRLGVPRQIFNLLVVWFLTGLWHGAGWNFILWGLYFFAVLVLEKFAFGKLLKKLPSFAAHIYTLMIILFSWVIFACNDINQLKEYVLALFGANGFMNGTSVYYLTTNAFLLVAGAILSTSIFKKAFEKFKCNSVKISIVLVLYITSILCTISESYNPFLYFRF